MPKAIEKSNRFGQDPFSQFNYPREENKVLALL